MELKIVLSNELTEINDLYIKVFKRRQGFLFNLSAQNKIEFRNIELIHEKLENIDGFQNKLFYYKSDNCNYSQCEIVFTDEPYSETIIPNPFYQDLFYDYIKKEGYEFETNIEILKKTIENYPLSMEKFSIEAHKNNAVEFTRTNFMFVDYILDAPKDVMWTILNFTNYNSRQSNNQIKEINIDDLPNFLDENEDEFHEKTHNSNIKSKILSALGMYIELNDNTPSYFRSFLKKKYRKYSFQRNKNIILMCPELIQNFYNIISKETDSEFNLLILGLNKILDVNLNKILNDTSIITEKVFYHELGHAIYSKFDKQEKLERKDKEFNANSLMSKFKDSLEFDALLLFMTRYQSYYYRPTFVSDNVMKRFKIQEINPFYFKSKTKEFYENYISDYIEQKFINDIEYTKT